jgi:hypothetical protein
MNVSVGNLCRNNDANHRILKHNICNSLKKFPESDNIFEMNNTTWDISMLGVGSIHDVTSERVLSSWALLSLSANCLFLWIIGLSYFKMSATELANKKFCFLTHISFSVIANG